MLAYNKKCHMKIHTFGRIFILVILELLKELQNIYGQNCVICPNAYSFSIQVLMCYNDFYKEIVMNSIKTFEAWLGWLV